MKKLKLASDIIKITENMIKAQIKDVLAYKLIFNFPLLQALGAYRGVPDRIIHYKGKVIYLEIKTPKGKMSQHQQEFQRQCIEDGVDYFAVSSIEELEQCLKK